MTRHLSEAYQSSCWSDLVKTSGVNFYEDVSEKEVDAFYNEMKDPNDNTPISYGLNSKVVKEDGVIKEQVYKIGGMYSQLYNALSTG